MSEAPGPHRLYPQISQEEWADAEDRMTEFIRRKAKDALGDPRDLARKVIVHAFKPETKPWDPAQRTLILYLGSIANSMMANAFRKKSFKLEVPLYTSTLAKEPDPRESPEEAVLRDEAMAQAEERLRRLEEALEGDRCSLILIDAAQRGERHAHRLAEAAGFSYREVELARERIGRAVEKVVREEARTLKGKR
jgi:hypothetical protein